MDMEAPCRYFHITACAPGGIADGDGGFAERICNHAVKCAQKEPAGQLEFPKDWLRVKWSPGKISSDGGSDYLVPFQTQDLIETQSESEVERRGAVKTT